MGKTKKIIILGVAIWIAVVVLVAVFVFYGDRLSKKNRLFYKILGTNDVNDSLRILKTNYANLPDDSILGTERLTMFDTTINLVNHSNKDICFNEKSNAQIYQFDEKNKTWIEIDNLSGGTTYLCVSDIEEDLESKTTHVYVSESEECLEAELTLIPWDDTGEGDVFLVGYTVSPSGIIDPSSPVRISVSGNFCESGEPVAAYFDIRIYY